MNAALYQVRIAHRRSAPVVNAFRYGSYMWLFDLAAPPRLPKGLGWLGRWRDRDHLDVRAALAGRGLEAERIVVLTNLAVLGYVFNPITLYWCYGAGGQLVAHVAEVHNTYGGRHCYVLPADGEPTHRVGKAMYVSPFYPVDGSYRITISEPAETLKVTVVLERPGDEPFRASLTGVRVSPSLRRLAGQFVRYPAAPLRGRVLIQLQGLRLWRRGVEVQPR